MPKRKKGKGKLDLRSLAKPWRIYLPEPSQQKNGNISPAVLITGFILLIIAGSFILILPISSRSGQFTPFIDALFTATSAVCVTGLVVLDTGTYWSLFGQIVILALIQLGGLGFMINATLLILALGRKIGLREKLLIGDSLGISKLGGVVGLVREIAVFTLIAEIAGAIIFYFHFSSESIYSMPVWQSIFLSVSAFNNAGFDLFGNFSSFVNHQSSSLLLMTAAILTILGGISYVVVADIVTERRFSRFSLDTKIVVVTTACLILGGTVIFFLTEFINPGTLGDMSFTDKLLVSFFQSAAARTSGFSAVNVANITPYCLFFLIVLMFIGGAAGSTASGIKVNTFGLLIATFFSSIRGREYAGAFGKEFIPQQIYRAISVVILSLAVITIMLFILTITEKIDFLDLFFETVSAFANVGLSTGISPGLSITGRLVITVSMFIGRLGPLALVLALIERQKPSTYRYTQESVRIG